MIIQKVIELKTIINEGLVYTVSTAYNALYPRSKFISTFFESFTPTTDVLTDFGNIAAAFGKDLTQIITDIAGV